EPYANGAGGEEGSGVQTALLGCPSRDQRADVLFATPAVDDARISRRNASFLVDEDRPRHGLEPVGVGEGFASEHDRVGQVPLLEVRTHGSPTVLVHRRADDGEPVAGVLLRELGEPRNLGLAPVTPGRPEVQEHHATPVPREVDGLSTRIRQLERRRGLPNGFGEDLSPRGRRREDEREPESGQPKAWAERNGGSWSNANHPSG